MAFNRSLLRTLFVAIAAALVFGVSSASAASGFQAGRIIDDGEFFNGGGLDASTIQQFLNSKVPVCDTNGTKAYGGTTRAAYGTSKGYPPPYICLKDYRQNTPSRPAESGLCAAYTGGNRSAAEIIQSVGQACGVNPKALIVLLEKEQSLVTDDWPWPTQYSSATGFGCPDTAPCDPDFGAFFDQVYYAARQFRRYERDASLFSYRMGRDNFIQYNPNASCGGTNVFLQNQATAGLYNYTPYQPNAAALNNMYGSGDACSAYGNRNFWRIYNDWFGATTSDSDTNTLSFVRLNHGSGKVENLGYTSIGNYQYITRSNFSSYPAVPADGAVRTLYKPNGDLCLIRLNHSSGKTELVCYSAGSGFQQMTQYALTAYPAIGTDKAVTPLFWPNGDLVFVRLNHGSGKVEIVSYSAGSNYQKLANYTLGGYPAVPADGAVTPLFWPNGDLVFVRLNHGSGKVEIVSYSAGSNYKSVNNISLTGYPAVSPDGAVIPLFKPTGDLTFVRLNHSSGKIEVVSYGAGSNYKNLNGYTLAGYPSVAPDGAVIPLFTR